MASCWDSVTVVIYIRGGGGEGERTMNERVVCVVKSALQWRV